MKTHELADALVALAKVLRAGPNVNLGELDAQLRASIYQQKNREIAVNIATLSRLSQIDKQQWIEFIKSHSIPVELRPRDAARDIIGKLLRYLDEHPEERSRIKKSSKAVSEEESPELAKALSFLLGEAGQ